MVTVQSWRRVIRWPLAAVILFRSYLKKVFWPNLGVGRSHQVLKILKYSCGLIFAAALTLNQNPFFEITSTFIGLSIGSAAETAPTSPAAGENRRTVLLLPFKNLVAIYGPAGNIRSPINGRVFLSGTVEDKAAGFMDANLHNLLHEKETYTLIAAERAADMLTALANRQPPLSERDLWVAAGRALGADAVLGGFIYRFQDRTGQDYGVDKAASVAFDLHLVRVLDGRIQWSGRVDETQQPLSNNIYKIKKFISRGGKWVTSRQMAQGGLKSLIADMPGR